MLVDQREVPLIGSRYGLDETQLLCLGREGENVSNVVILNPQTLLKEADRRRIALLGSGKPR